MLLYFGVIIPDIDKFDEAKERLVSFSDASMISIDFKLLSCDEDGDMDRLLQGDKINDPDTCIFFDMASVVAEESNIFRLLLRFNGLDNDDSELSLTDSDFSEDDTYNGDSIFFGVDLDSCLPNTSGDDGAEYLDDWDDKSDLDTVDEFMSLMEASW